MDITKYMGPEQILLGLDVGDKWELLDVMTDAVLRHPVCQRQTNEVKGLIKSLVIERERSMSTGMGNGYALPHARVPGFGGFAISIAVLKNGVEYESPDGRPAKFICMVICPAENPTIVLKVISALSRFLQDETADYIFYNEDNPKKLYDYLKEKQISLDISIQARDIMRTRITTVNYNTPLQRVTGLMFANRMDSIAVTDENGFMKGEITCDMLFKRGIPDFFNQLSSVSFIRDFDPFEKYFTEEVGSTAGQVMLTDYALVEGSATLMEVVYLLSIKRYAKIYVVNGGKLCGTIDRITVLDQILNL